jgi:hypothetical protein
MSKMRIPVRALLLLSRLLPSIAFLFLASVVGQAVLIVEQLAPGRSYSLPSHIVGPRSPFSCLADSGRASLFVEYEHRGCYGASSDRVEIKWDHRSASLRADVYGDSKYLTSEPAQVDITLAAAKALAFGVVSLAAMPSINTEGTSSTSHSKITVWATCDGRNVAPLHIESSAWSNLDLPAALSYAAKHGPNALSQSYVLDDFSFPHQLYSSEDSYSIWAVVSDYLEKEGLRRRPVRFIHPLANVLRFTRPGFSRAHLAPASAVRELIWTQVKWGLRDDSSLQCPAAAWYTESEMTIDAAP